MIYGIIAALDEEVSPLIARMNISEKKELYGTTVYKGILGKNEVVLCKCGIATINAALCTSVLIREFGAEVIINIGIAGSVGDGIEALDVVVSTEAVYHDRDDNILIKYYPYATRFVADEGLVEKAVVAAKALAIEGKPVKVHSGRIVSGDWFIASHEKKRELAERFDPLCVEMEGAAVANAAFMSGVPFVIVRTMSDNADESAEMSYDMLINKAGEISAAIVFKMLEV